MALHSTLLCAGMLALALSSASALAVDHERCEILKSRHVMQSAAPVNCEQLQLLHFSYIDFAGKRRDDGEIMVMAAAAPQVQAIFETLLKRGFPLARAHPMEHYQGDDEASMADNNTSAFNHRPITGGKQLSLHAYGLAIDINPLQNPYVRRDGQGRLLYSPEAGRAYAKRVPPGGDAQPGSSEQVVELFAEHGFFIWGGDWKKPVDYQHFQVSRNMAERMAGLPLPAARQLFERSIAAYRACRRTHQATPKARTECAAAAG
ncbi:M15 family metallopeptidase [Paraherbaspirillum soli]|uniref:M15 family metallopeptidase n=1 Tax=Paraherbaspirillum soli TaxID=631222 RepID=A0ABW0M9Q6_9BURK